MKVNLIPQLLGLVILAGTVACSNQGASPPPAAASPAPQVIFHNGIILTMDDSESEVQAVAILDALILAVGEDDQVMALADSETQLIDLQGKTLLPGFIDSHQHRIGDREYEGYSNPEQVIQLAIEQGWTSISELFVDEGRLAELRSLDASGKLRLRVNAYLALANPEGQPYGDWYKEYEAGFEYSPYLRLGGVKLHVDHGWGRGESMYTQNQLDQMLVEAHNLNWQIAVHTVGEPAHTMVLNSLELAQGGVSNPLYRHRIEHVAVISDSDLQRMRDLGILASVQLNGPGTWVEWSDWDDEVTPDMYPHIARYRDLLDAGVFAIGSGDWPWGVAPIEPSFGSPMLLLYQAVTRSGSYRRPAEPWMLDQAITIEEALQLLTINGAYGSSEESKKGSIEVGKFADLVILSQNPLTSPIEQVPDIQILMTMIGREVEYCAAGQESFCP